MAEDFQDGDVTRKDVLKAVLKVDSEVCGLVQRIIAVEARLGNIENENTKINGCVRANEKSIVVLQERVAQGGRNWTALIGLAVVILQFFILARLENILSH